mmetsp:Transcript_19270/g.55992  ORF Transcript_19270/g.55992 Transcript_19270/m.55992 type:complete len:249 (-) Transcript_19270:99-845(-)
MNTQGSAIRDKKPKSSNGAYIRATTCPTHKLMREKANTNGYFPLVSMPITKSPRILLAGSFFFFVFLPFFASPPGVASAVAFASESSLSLCFALGRVSSGAGGPGGASCFRSLSSSAKTLSSKRHALQFFLNTDTTVSGEYLAMRYTMSRMTSVHTETFLRFGANLLWPLARAIRLRIFATKRPKSSMLRLTKSRTPADMSPTCRSTPYNTAPVQSQVRETKRICQLGQTKTDCCVSTTDGVTRSHGP